MKKSTRNTAKAIEFAAIMLSISSLVAYMLVHVISKNIHLFTF